MWISKEKYERLLSQIKIQDARIVHLASRVYALEQERDVNISQWLQIDHRLADLCNKIIRAYNAAKNKFKKGRCNHGTTSKSRR